MSKAAFVVLAGTESHENLGRLVNALEGATEFEKSDGDEVELIFDGAGTQWIPELEDEEHDYHDLYADLRDEVSVCDYCTSAFDVDEGVGEADVDRIGENDGHPSISSLVDDEYEIITF